MHGPVLKKSPYLVSRLLSLLLLTPEGNPATKLGYLNAETVVFPLFERRDNKSRIDNDNFVDSFEKEQRSKACSPVQESWPEIWR